MVADTRSAQKLKNGADGHSSKRIQQDLPVGSSRKIENVGLRRSTRGTPSKQMTPIHPITQNSEKVPLRTPPSKSKSQRADTTPAPLRRSDRRENPVNHDLRQSAEESTHSKRRNAKAVIQVTMESKQTEIDPEEGGVRRKRVIAQRMAYKAIFKRQSVKKTEPDVVVKQKHLGQSLHDSVHNRLEIGPLADAAEDVGDNCGEMILCYARDEGTDKVSNGVRSELISDSKASCPVISSDSITVDTNLSNTVVDGTIDGNNSDGSCTHSTYGEKRDDSSNCGEMILRYSREECIDKDSDGVIPELISGPKDRSSEISTDNINVDTNILDTVVDGTLDGDGMNGSCTPYMQYSASPLNGDKDVHPREAISGGGITNLQQTCSPCSENERVRDDSPDQEHCSNRQVGKEDIGSVSTIKDTGDGIAACATETSKKCSSQVGILSDGEDNQRNVCTSCNKDGELLYCDGKWQCTLCVKKKPLNEHQSKYLEYWVPAQLSNYQLELYCSTLLSNSLYLRSSSKNEPFGMLREILSTVRKSCDHPYLLHPSIQGQLFAELRSAGDILDAGIKASGKLLLLDMMLSEIQTRGFKVLVLYQLTGGLTSLGSILEDFLRQRFGPHTYEHVGAGVVLPKKQAAVNRFNKKEDGQFIFLLENRACSSSIKSLELDIIIMYNSDLNPANDLRMLQKIRIESTAEQIKIFRLYSSCTVEEQALLLSKKNLNIDSSLQTKSRATCDSLLCWGASYLFSKLDEHLADKTTSTSNLSFGTLLMNNVTEEFRDIISEDKDTSKFCISKAQMDVGRYITSIPLAGESEGHLKDGEEPHVFWTNLLNRKITQWKYMTDPSPRNRKRVRYFDTSSESGREDSAPRQRKKVVDEVTKDAGSDGGSSTSQRDGDNCNNNRNSTFDQSSSGTEALAGKRVVSFDEQKSLQLLQLETNKLCQILKLSEDTALATGRFLEYVSKNHQTHSDLSPIMHAFQISLCWIGASITKQKIDKRESLISAKQLLDYQCTEEQVSSVYLKMRSLKRMYMECSENTHHSGRNVFSAKDFSKEPPGTADGGAIKNSSLEKSGEMEVGETTANDMNAEEQILSPPEQTQNDKAAWREINEKIEEIKKNSLERMTKLVQKHEKEIEEFSRDWEEKRHSLDRDYKLESAFIRSIHSQGSVRAEKLKVLDVNFSKKIKEHDLLRNLTLKNLEDQQLAARNEEQKKTDSLVAEEESYLNELRSVRGPQFGSESEEDAGVSQSSRSRIPTNGPETVSSAPSQHLESNNEGLSLSTQRNDISKSEVHSCDSPPETSSDLVKSDQTAVLLDCTDFPPQQLCNDNDNASLMEIPDTSPKEVAGPIQHLESVQAAVLPDCTDLPPQQLCADKDDSPMEILDARPNEVAGPIQPVESAQTAVLPDCTTDLPLQQVLQDEVQRDLVPAELRNQDATAVENNNTSPAPCSMSGIVESINPVLSNVTPPTNETHVADSSEHMHDAPVDVSSHRSPVTEVEQQNFDQGEQQNHDDQGRSSLPTMEPDSIEMIAHEPVPQHDHPVVESGRSGRLAEDIEPSSSSPMVSAGVPVESTYGFQNQNILPGQSNPFLAPPPPPPQVNYRNVGHPYVPDPLQHALEQMEKEAQSLRKKREDKVKELQSDRDKEIQEIMQKYDQKIREVEVEHNLKKKEHDNIMEKVRLNRKLAEAFRYKCLDSRPPGIPQMQRRGFPSGYTPQLHHPTVQSSTRLHPRASSHQIPLQNLVRPSPSSHQNFAATPVQNIQPPPTLIRPHAPGPLSRPPVIGSFTRPSSGPHVSGEVRARAPHLQSFNRSSVSSTAVTPQAATSQVPQLRFTPPLSAGPEQRVNTDNGYSMHQNLGSSAWPNALPSMESAVGNVDGSNLTSHNGGTGVVCLSDDE